MPPSFRFPPLREGNQAARLFGSPCGQGEPYGADKGTSVRHRIAAARAIFPSASVNGWARLFALTPFVPLSRRRERGVMECGSEASAHAEANASALQTGQRTAPLSHAVGEGLGVRA